MLMSNPVFSVNPVNDVGLSLAVCRVRPDGPAHLRGGGENAAVPAQDARAARSQERGTSNTQAALDQGRPFTIHQRRALYVNATSSYH